ncbi:MAG: DUF1569 domain-containing protein [Calditrichaeota bacterium]|nr:MAG: DUF1569 domain-containing protein [Calditrichota bacterium]
MSYTLEEFKTKIIREHAMKKYIAILKAAAKKTYHPTPNWGNMDFHNMIEHLGFAFELVLQKNKCATPAEQIPRQQAFLRTDKPMPHNFRYPYLPPEPLPYKFAGIDEAIDQLEKAIEKYQIFWRENPEAIAVHPVFGEMGHALWDRVHTKHMKHHFAQFSIAIESN